MDFLSAMPGVWAVGIGGFAVLWPVSLWRRDSSIVDFWWGPGFAAMALALWWQAGRPADGYTLAMLVPLLVWGVRLGVHLGLRRLREGHEDPRYQELRARFAPGWWWKSLLVVFLLQGVLQAAVASGVLAGLAAAPAAAPSPVVWLLCAVALAAVAVETVSDLQLDRFRATTPSGGLLTTGLRAHVRYPSYSAEIVFWSAMSLMAMGAGVWWAWTSALLIGALLIHVSGVAILERRLAHTRAEAFARYRARVPALVPGMAGRGKGPWRETG